MYAKGRERGKQRRKEEINGESEWRGFVRVERDQARSDVREHGRKRGRWWELGKRESSLRLRTQSAQLSFFSKQATKARK